MKTLGVVEVVFLNAGCPINSIAA